MQIVANATLDLHRMTGLAVECHRLHPVFCSYAFLINFDRNNIDLGLFRSSQCRNYSTSFKDIMLNARLEGKYGLQTPEI